MRRKWTQSDRDYVVKNYGSKSLSELAKHFGVSNKALGVRISVWRNQGLPIPNTKRKDVGTVTIRSDNRGGTLVFEKTETGWKCIERRPKGLVKKIQRDALFEPKKRGRPVGSVSAKKKIVKPKNVAKQKNIVKPKKVITQKEVKVLHTKKLDMNGKEWVKVDNKTWVCRKKRNEKENGKEK